MDHDREAIVSCVFIENLDAFSQSQSVSTRSQKNKESTSASPVPDLGTVFNVYWLTHNDFQRLADAMLQTRLRHCTHDFRGRVRARLGGPTIRSVTVAKPTHQSPGGPGYEQIMGYPDPKPMDQARVFKVIPWNQIEDALRTVVERFWLAM